MSILKNCKDHILLHFIKINYCAIVKFDQNNDRVSHQEQKDIEKALRQSLLEAKARSTSKTKSHKQRSSPRTLKIKSPITGLREKQEQSVVKEKGASPKTIVKIKSPITGVREKQEQSVVKEKGPSPKTIVKIKSPITGVREKQEQSVAKEKGPSPKTKQKDSKANNGEVTTNGSSKPSLRPSSAYVPPPPLELMKEDIFAILSDEDETSSSTSDIEFTSGSYKKKKNAESTTKISRKRKSKSDDCLPAKKKAYTKEKVQLRHAPSSSKTLSGDLTRKNGKKDASLPSSKGRSLKGILKKDPLMYVISNDDKLITKKSPAQSKRTPSPRIQKKLFKKTPSPSVGSPFSTTPVKKVLSSLKSPKASSHKDTVSSSTPPNKKTSPHHRKTPPPAIAKKTACGHIRKTPVKKTLKKTPTKIKKTPVKKSPSSSKKTATPANTSVQTIPKTPESKKSKSVEETDAEEEEKEKQVSLDEAQKKIVESTTPPVERSPLR